MKLSSLVMVGLPLILSAACASLPGASTVEAPQPVTLAALPPPPICLIPPVAPDQQTSPTLPDLVAAPEGPIVDNVRYWRAMATHLGSRALRAEITSSFAANVADGERSARVDNALVQTGCTMALEAREPVPVP